MAEPRILLLFDPKATPASWNEQLIPGEYAVLYRGMRPPLASKESVGLRSTDPICVVFGSLSTAEEYAMRQVAEFPTLCCRIYDHQGLGCSPAREIVGAEGADKNEISARFRRWGGAGFLLAGFALGLTEWMSNFTVSWAGMIAARIVPVGVVLLVTELAIVLESKRKERRERRPQ